MVVSVAIVSPQPATSHELQRALGEIDGLETQIVTLEVDIAIRRIARADVVVLHSELPDHTLMRLLRTLLFLPGTTLPVVVDAPDDPDILIGYLEHGVVGYVLASESRDRLREVVVGVTEGKGYINPAIATLLIDRYRALRQRFRQHDRVENDLPGRHANDDSE